MTDGNNKDEELILDELLGSLRTKDLDRDFLEEIKSLAEKCFENRRYQEVYRLHNKWSNHVTNILKYIADFCTKSGIDLNKDEWTILIAAAILHDIGKSLYIMHPDIMTGKYKDDSTVLEALENSHHVISFLFIQSLFKYQDKVIEIFETEDLFTNMQNEIQIDFPLSLTARYIIGKPKWKEYLQCAAWMALRHKQLKEKHLYIFKPELKEYLERVTGPVDDETYEEKALEFFGKEIKKNCELVDINNSEFLKATQQPDGPDRFSILSALLQLGDKLDISKKRLRMSYFYLEVLLDDIADREVLRDNLLHPQSMTRWFQFYYTGEPMIEEDTKNCGIRINIPYFYPESIRNDFLYFRYKSEKDFEDLGIISTLERTLKIAKNNNEDFRLTLERTENKNKKGKSLRIIGLENRKERLAYCLRKICKECLKTGKKELKFDDVNKEIKKIFGDMIDNLSCIRSTSSTLSQECPLVQYIIKIFDMDTAQPSYPDWEKYSFALPANIRRLLCRECEKHKTDEDKKKKFLKELNGKRIRISLSPQAKEGLKKWKADAEEDRKKLLPGTIFYPPKNSPQYNSESNIRRIPVSLDVAILLNLFRHLRDESLTVEDISNISGLDRGRILKYCGWLEHDQYLLLDDKKETYKINLAPTKYSIVERVLKDFDSQRSEMVSKIRDIDRFGKPLALYSELNNERIKTNIKGLDQILCPFENQKMWGLPLRKSILLVGPPGSGKTTLALDIIRQVRLQRLPEEIALYLTFSGDIQRLGDDFKSLGWEYHDIAACVRSLSTLQGKTYLTDPDKFFKHLLNILDEFSPDLVAIDNLGYFLTLVPPEFCREIFNRLIKVLTVRGITSILIGDDIPNGIGFECFDTDGVICIYYKDGKRELEITKMRGREFAGGRHPFKIKGLSEEYRGKTEELDKPIVEVFPNIQMHLEYAQRKKKEVEKKQEPIIIKGSEESEKKHTLKSGIKGLDELLPVVIKGKGKESGFEQGEIILILGSPGAGKTVSGLHFLAEGYLKGNEEKVLWVSFESDLDGLQLATRSFSEKAGVRQLVIEMERNKHKMFRFFPPAQLDPNELVNFLLESCDKNELQRIVLDSVNDIEQAFDSDMAFKSFMTSLVQLLRGKGVTVMFLYRTRNFFGKAEDIGRVLASVVDTIICLKVLDIQNAVQKGLFLLKVRGREHKSKLLSIDFKEDEGMTVFDRGWAMSGLISGEAGEIKEPRVSVKLFFENRNEFLINALIISEYNRRFKGGLTTFVHVRKPQIYSEFLSFKGASGPGHSNVRVLSLCDYWADHFQRQGKFYDLGEYVSPATRHLVHQEEFWRRCATYSFKKHAFEIFSIPNYVDVGVLAFHRRLIQLKKFWTTVKLEIPKSVEDARKQLARLTWNMLDPTNNPDITKVLDKSNKNKLSPQHLFTMPSLESKASFVSFFLEVYWSFGGVIFDLRELFFEYARECKDFLSEEKIDKVIKVEDILFFKTQAIELKGNMAFIAEIFMLIPERILNNAIRYMNVKFPNFIGDICRHGEVVLEKFLREKAVSQGEKIFLIQIEKMSGISNIDDPLDAFLRIYPIRKEYKVKKPIFILVAKLINELQKDEIWNNKNYMVAQQEATIKDLLSAFRDTKKILASVITAGDEKEKATEKKHILIILYFVLSRIISNRERYQKLLEWYFKPKKEEQNEKGEVKLNDEEKEKKKKRKYDFLSKIIIIGQVVEENKTNGALIAGKNTLEFLFQMVNSGVAPNPHYGIFNDQAFLARKWSGDVSSRPKLPPSKDLISELDLNMPPDAYEYKQNEKEKTNYRIAPLPSFEQNNKRSSCAVMGLWSLGITKPALSPEIGWLFIDTLTEDRYVRFRAKKGLGLPAKVSAYQRESIRQSQPDIYGHIDDKGNLKEEGIIHYYDLATQDKAQEKPSNNPHKNGVYYSTRERTTIPYYYQIEEFLIKELSRFFEPSFFAILGEKNDSERKELIKTVLKRIHNRIKNFLVKEFKLDEEPGGEKEDEKK